MIVANRISTMHIAHLSTLLSLFIKKKKKTDPKLKWANTCNGYACSTTSALSGMIQECREEGLLTLLIDIHLYVTLTSERNINLYKHEKSLWIRVNLC